jgi:hypothetical protein
MMRASTAGEAKWPNRCAYCGMPRPDTRDHVPDCLYPVEVEGCGNEERFRAVERRIAKLEERRP